VLISSSTRRSYSSEKRREREREERKRARVVAVDLKYRCIDRSIDQNLGYSRPGDFETARKPVVTFLTLYHFTKNKYYYYIICAF